MWQFPHFTPNRAPDWDALTARFDWLADMAAVPQDAEWHGEGDVLTHTKMVAAELFRLPEYQELDEQAQHILFAAALGRICPDTAELLERIALFQALCEENQSWGASYPFSGCHARYHYLNHPESSPDYHPYDDFACTVYMMSALPGSGKDTHIAQRFPKLPVLSLDDIRRAHRIDPADKKAAGRVIQLGKEQARQYLRDRQDFVFNATNLTRELRGKWTSLFADYRARIHIIYLEVPWPQLLRQNKQREHSVPEAVIRRLLGKLEIPSYDEAHEVEYCVAE